MSDLSPELKALTDRVEFRIRTIKSERVAAQLERLQRLELKFVATGEKMTFERRVAEMALSIPRRLAILFNYRK